jgi:hypothetical protein
MKHPDDHALVMSIMGDSDDNQSIAEHLGTCDDCRARRAELSQVLETAVAGLEEPPVPDANFESRIWARQRAALLDAGAIEAATPPAAETGRSAASLLFWRRSLQLGAVAALLVVAFLAGLYNAPPGTEIVPEGSVGAGDRVLFVAVGDHLASSRMVLVELANATTDGTVDISSQQQRAQALLADNRLYRQTARLNGEVAVADLLEDLERILLEVARTSGEVPGEELDWLRDRIAERDLIFKVNVIEAQTRREALPGRDEIL